MHGAGVVHRLVGHAGRHRAVADHGDDVGLVVVRQRVGHRHAEAGGDRGGRVAGAERVVRAFAAVGEPAESAALAQGADALATPRQDLVGIGLVTDVPDDAVVRRVEDVVQRDRQLDNAEPRAEVPARDGDRVDRLGAQLVRDLVQIGFGELAEVVRRGDRVEQRGLRGYGHIHLFRCLLAAPSSASVPPSRDLGLDVTIVPRPLWPAEHRPGYRTSPGAATRPRSCPTHSDFRVTDTCPSRRAGCQALADRQGLSAVWPRTGKDVLRPGNVDGRRRPATGRLFNVRQAHDATPEVSKPSNRPETSNSATWRPASCASPSARIWRRERGQW